MNKATKFLALGAVCTIAGALTGCSSSASDPYGPTPDFASVQAKYEKPSGTFAAGGEGSVLSGYATETKNSQSSGLGIGVSGVPSMNGPSATGGVQMQSLKILGGNTGSTSFCAGLEAGDSTGSCACPNGGSIAYDFSGVQALKQYKGGPIDVTLRVHASACTVGDASVDGSEFVKMSSAGTPSASDLVMLFDIHMTATSKAVSARIDADFEYENGKFWYSVTVNDGYVIVSSDAGWNQGTETGNVYVRDRDETWTCAFIAGAGTCTSDKGGTRTVGSASSGIGVGGTKK